MRAAVRIDELMRLLAPHDPVAGAAARMLDGAPPMRIGVVPIARPDRGRTDDDEPSAEG